MNFLLEIALATFLLVGFAFVSIRLLRRAKTVERQLGLLMRAALSNTKGIRSCADGIENGFSDLARSENQHRVMLASLNSQMSNLDAMLHAGPVARESSAASGRITEDAGVPALVPPATPRIRKSAAVAGKQSALPGYRAIANRPGDSVVLTANEEAGRRRKVKTIEAFFRKVEQPAVTVGDAEIANTAGGGAQPADGQKPAEKKPAGDKSAAPAQASATSFADLVSQRRNVVNG